MASSPLALDGFTTLDRLIGAGTLLPSEQVVVKLVAAQHFGRDYCLAVHTMLSRRQGLSDAEVSAIRKGEVENARHMALINFARATMASRRQVGDADLDAFRSAGFGDQQVIEVIAVVALIFRASIFNNVNQTVLDFPAASEL